MNRRALMVACVLTPVVTAGRAHAQPAIATTPPAAPAPAAPPLQVALDMDSVWRLDSSYRLLSTSRTATAVGVSLAYDVARLGGGGTLAATAGWQSESAGGDPGRGGVPGDDGPSPATAGTSGAVERASFQASVVTAGVVARWRLTRWLEPLARVTAGGAWGKLDMGLSDGTRWIGHAFSPQVAAGAGLRVHTAPSRLGALPGQPQIAAAAAVEGGFIAGAPMSFALAPPAPAQPTAAGPALATGTADVGRLGRAQPYLRVTFALLF